MDFMKVFDQTVREIKREVNLKVLKIPEIEQKVLDATDNEPWGPHGSDLAEIAKATKKFSECQMVMNVLWSRLIDTTGKDWRHAYKALTVIEYLVANGSERAVDEIVEHTFQISSLSTFEFVEPNGKDLGINVRKKVETIVALLNDKDKIQAARQKATANRDKYVGLSSTGISYKSSSVSYGSSGGNYQKKDIYDDSGDRKESYSSRDTHKVGGRYGEEKVDPDAYVIKSRRAGNSEIQGNTKNKDSTYHNSKDRNSSNLPTKTRNYDSFGSIQSQNPTPPSSNEDDFDPRGTSSNKSTAGNSNQVDLFGDSLMGDFMDAPSLPSRVNATNDISSEADLFADTDFVSAPSNVRTGPGSQVQAPVDLFASQPAFPPASSASVNLFASQVPAVQAETKPPRSEPNNTNTIDPFASVPLNNFDGSDMFSSFTSHTDTVSEKATQSQVTDTNPNNYNGKSSLVTETPPKKGSFQVKSGVWADSLSRGLIDLNISAPKKVSLADIGVVGGLSDGSDDRDMFGPPTSFYMGKAMGGGSGLGTSSGYPYTSANSTNDNIFSNPTPNSQQQHSLGSAGPGREADDFFSNLGSKDYQYSSFKK